MFRKILFLAIGAIATALYSASSATADEGKMRVFATWEANGSFMQTGAAEATLIGTISGQTYVDTDQGPVSAGDMACAIVVHQNLKNATQQGNGQCTLKGPMGNLWFMTLSCTGVPLVGCAGDSTLTGGTGPFEKLTGGGHFVIRSNMLELAKSENADMKDKVKGIIFWRELHFKTP